jgi:hypothetical protein
VVVFTHRGAGFEPRGLGGRSFDGGGDLH